MNEARVLALSLHGRLVGYLVGARDGRNILTFDAGFRDDPLRPTFSLITSPAFPNAQPLLSKPWVTRQRLHPVLSNLLPEGALRAFIAQSLKVHENNEFEMMAYLGADLPGALVAEPAHPDDLPPGSRERIQRHDAGRDGRRGDSGHSTGVAG